MRHSKLVASGLLAFAFACAGTASNVDPLADQSVRAQGTITLSASHSPGSSTVSPSVEVSFVPDTSTVLTSCGESTINTCTITQAPDCTSLGCQAGETCGWDDSCNAACVAACTLTCGDGQHCVKDGSGNQSCNAIQTFDAGAIAISGGTLPISIYPPYAWKTADDGAPFAPGAELRVQAAGPTGAGFAAFDLSFKATTLLEANPPLDQLSLDDVFGSSDVMLGWVPGNDRIYVNLEGAGGSARCLAQDAAGAFSLPRDVITAVLGTSKVQALSLSIERSRLDRHTDAKTIGSLDDATIQPKAWIDLMTTSTESISLQACKSNETSCGTKCVDTSSDANNCGACGNSCGMGSCSNGTCQTTSGGSCGSCASNANFSTCSSEYAACTGTCNSLVTCIMGCNGNTSCTSTCYSTYASGETTAFTDYTSCLCGSACTTECAAQCH